MAERNERGKESERKERSLLRRLLVGAAALVGVLLLLVVGAYAWLSSGPGRDWLRGTIEAAVTEPGVQELRIAALDGPLPGSVTLRDVTLADAQGIWLSAEQVELAWRPLALLRRTLSIEAIDVTDLTVARLPESTASEEQEPEPFSPPRLPLDVTLERLTVDELSLGESVLGQAARFRISGALAANAGDVIRSELHAVRSDEAEGTLDIEAAYRPDSDHLTFDAKLSAAEGGLLAQVLELPGLPAAAITLAGEGALSDWHGRLGGTLQDVVAVQAELAITRDPDLHLTASGRVEAGTLPDEPPWPLLAGATDFELDAAWRDDSLLDLQRLTIDGSVVRAALSGRLDNETLDSTLQAALTLDQSPALDRMVAPAVLQRLEVSAELQGPLLQPAITSEVMLQGFAAPGFAADTITATARVESDGPLDGPAPRLAIDATGGVQGPRLEPAEAMAPLLGQSIDWSARGQLDLDALRFDASRLSVATAQVSAEGPATVNLDSGAASASLSVAIDDLAVLSALTSLDMNGAGQLQAELEAEDFFSALRMTVNGRLSDFRSGIAQADPLLGPTPTLGADIALAEDGALSITAARVEGAAASLTANAELPADSDSITADFAARVADLSLLSNSLGSRLAGSAEVDGRLSGPIGDPGSDGRLVLTNARVEDMDLGQVEVSYDVAGLASGPRGDVTLEAPTAAGRLAGSGSFALQEDELTLSDLALAGEGSSLKGDLVVPLDGAAMTGEITARIATLAPWLALAGQDGDGAAGIRARLSAPGGKQRVQVAAKLARLSYPLGPGEALSVESADVSASIADLTNPLAADLQLSATGLQAAPATLSELTLNAQGDGQGADFTLTARGDMQGELALNASGRIALDGEATTLSLASLEGTVIGRSLALRQQTRLTFGDDSLRLEDLLLDFSGGSLAASAAIDRETIAAELRVDALPLDLIEVAAPQTAIDGSLSGRLQLTGARNDPSGSAHFETSDLRLKEASDIPAIKAVVDADWRSGRLAVDGNLSGFAAEPATFSLEAPLRLDPEALAVNLPGNEPISGELGWSGDLAQIWPLVPLDGHRLAGRAELAAQVAGSLDEPRLSGRAGLSDGVYENLEVGTLLKGLTVELEMAGEEARLVSLSAGDGNGGRLTAEGNLELAPERGFPFALSSDFTDFTLVRRDDATAVSDGRIELSGSTERAEVRGTVTVKRAEIRVSRDLPPEVVDLEVVEVNASAIGKSEETIEPAPAGTEVALDLVIDMPGRIFVRGQGLDSEWSGKLAITGTAAEPIINGDLSVVRGQLNLIGRTFVLDKGVISFTGGKEINPLLDVAARYDGGDLSVTALVTGSAQDPQFSLTSVPSLPQDEIVSRVLFGKTSSQLSALEAVQLAQVVASLSGKGGQSEGVLDFARNLLGVDVLQVEASGEGGPEVTAGRYLTEKVYVGVKQGAAASSGSVGVEVELTPNISVKSDVGQTGESDIGINFKWDY